MNLFNDLSQISRISGGCDGDKQTVTVNGAEEHYGSMTVEEMQEAMQQPKPFFKRERVAEKSATAQECE